MKRRKRLKSPLKNEYAARETALGLLARREHSRRELILKLRARDCPDSIISKVIDALLDEGMQSDERFTETFIRNRFERGAGPIRIRAELTVRGVDSEIIDRFMADYDDWWGDLAVEVYQKRYRNKPPADYAEKAKRANFLQNRGFTHDQIRYALEFADGHKSGD